LSSHPIAVLGENLVDLLVSPDGTVNAVVGGGPLNVARSIGRLGGDARFISGVSDDAFGTFVREALADSNVKLALDTSLAQPTTLAVVELNAQGPRYHFHLTDTAAFALDARETSYVVQAISDLAAIYVGTLGLLVEPMASLGETLIMGAPADTLVVIDPNCRPSAVRDHAQYRARVARLSKRADVVKVSTEDLEYLHPELSSLEGARTILGHGAICVIVTDGPAPVTALTNEFEINVTVAPIDVVDTVGAGDALVGGFITWWTGHDLTRQQLHDAATLESAIAAAIDISRLTCQRAGAQPPQRKEVLGLDRWHWL
jgi:fructokinase